MYVWLKRTDRIRKINLTNNLSRPDYKFLLDDIDGWGCETADYFRNEYSMKRR